MDNPSCEFDPHEDKIREECGVFGIFGIDSAASLTALGLHALQHRMTPLSVSLVISPSDITATRQQVDKPPFEMSNPFILSSIPEGLLSLIMVI